MAKVRLATKRDLSRFLKKHPEWKLNKRETQLQRSYVCKDYVSGLVFAARITVHAEIMNHHPEVTLTYGVVKVQLTTHDLKALSNLDLTLAGKIDELHKKA